MIRFFKKKNKNRQKPKRGPTKIIVRHKNCSITRIVQKPKLFLDLCQTCVPPVIDTPNLIVTYLPPVFAPLLPCCPLTNCISYIVTCIPNVPAGVFTVTITVCVVSVSERLQKREFCILKEFSKSLGLSKS